MVVPLTSPPPKVLLILLLVWADDTSLLDAFVADAPRVRAPRVSPGTGESPRRSSETEELISDRRPLPPGRPSPPFLRLLFDDSLRLLNPKTMGSYQVERRERFGCPIFRSNIFLRPTVFCTDRDSLQRLAAAEADQRNGVEAFFPPHHRRLFGERSLIVLSGESHRRLRGLIATALTPTVIRSYEGLIDDSVEGFLRELRAECGGVDDYVRVVPKLRSFFISLTLRVVLGSETGDEEESRERARRLAKDIEIWAAGLLAPSLTFLPWSRASRAMRARRRIVSRLEDIMSDPSLGDGLLVRLIEARDDEDNSLTPEEVVDNVLSLVFAGSDTTASAATSLWMTLSTNPQLREELKGAVDDSGGTTTDVDALVSAVLQANPPAPFQFRQIAGDADLEIGEYRVPSNHLLVYGFAGALDEDPPDLRSQRLDEVTSRYGRSSASTSAAFGVGPRMCPGRFLATTELISLGRALSGANWTLEEDQDLEQRYTPGFFPVGGLLLKMD